MSGSKQPIDTAPYDGTVIQVGGPYEWVRAYWNGEFFALYSPGHPKNGSDFDLKGGKPFWRADQ